MLQTISIKNFQSLHDVHLDLTRFTVIVGPSSSGKSAFTRALHTLVHNRRGLGFLTHGERLMQITAQTERGTVTLSRGKGTEDNYYSVIPTGEATKQQKWTKLASNVPEEVSAFLGLYPSGHAFAAQHDMPYLLADSASSNASVLGRLTNVTVIFDAAREAKRQALDASKTLRLRAADLSTIEDGLDRFEFLASQQENLTSAEEKISRAYGLQRSINSITSAKESLVVAAGAVKRLRAAAEVTPPDVTPALRTYAALQGLITAKAALIDAAKGVKVAQAAVSATADEQLDVETERAALRANTENIFRERFEATEHGPDIPIPLAAAIAAQTVEDISA